LVIYLKLFVAPAAIIALDCVELNIGIISSAQVLSALYATLTLARGEGSGGVVCTLVDGNNGTDAKRY
jgi:hypothetical protein